MDDITILELLTHYCSNSDESKKPQRNEDAAEVGPNEVLEMSAEGAEAKINLNMGTKTQARPNALIVTMRAEGTDAKIDFKGGMAKAKLGRVEGCYYQY